MHASVVVIQGHRCSVASRILLEEGLNPCPLHWQAYYYLLHREGHATLCILKTSEKRCTQHIDGECHLGIFNDPMDFFFFFSNPASNHQPSKSGIPIYQGLRYNSSQVH